MTDKNAMTEVKNKRRGVIDTLIVRDRTAVFWFLSACGVAAACAVYLTAMAAVLRERPPFVVMDTSGAYFVPPGEVYRESGPMHLHLANMFAETLLERTPEGLVYQDRIDRLCWEDEKRNTPALAQIKKELERESQYFVSQKANQTARIEGSKVLQSTNTRVRTMTTGVVYRTSIFSGKEKLETFRFELDVLWHQNLRILANKGFPSQVETLGRLSLEKISEQDP